MKALILFSSREGQTLAIANHIANHIKNQIECDVRNLLHDEEISWAQYDRVLIGGSIHYGHFHPAVAKFIKRYLADLQQRVSGFFCVNLTARRKDKCTPESNIYTRKFLQQSPWRPDCCAVFAGALRYTRYRWCDRIMIRLIMRMTGGETDASKEVEYTNWIQVVNFAQQFACLPKKPSNPFN